MIASFFHDLRQLASPAQVAALLLMLAPAAWSAAQENSTPAQPPATDAAANASRTGSVQSPLPALRQALPAAPGTAGREVLPISGKILRYAQKLITKYDASGDGVLQADEWGRMAGTPRLADLNGDGELTVQEMAERVASYSQQRSLRLMPTPMAERGSPLAGGIQSPAAGLGTPVDAPAGAPNAEPMRPKQFFVPAEQLPGGLAEWFSQKDRDGDSQVTMAEFADKWTQFETAEFARYDANGDGVITPLECSRAHATKMAEEAAAQRAAEAAQAPTGAAPPSTAGRPMP